MAVIIGHRQVDCVILGVEKECGLLLCDVYFCQLTLFRTSLIYNFNALKQITELINLQCHTALNLKILRLFLTRVLVFYRLPQMYHVDGMQIDNLQ